MVSHSELRKLFYSADAVCFDVDSTVIREEGIDELAKICGVEDVVSEMELVSRLQERNVQVFLISGGFRSIVEHVASKLNIPGTNVFANRLKFYFNGEYAGFDETQPTAESGGKGKVIKLLKEKFHFKKIIMIGDGATDMEACPPADAFIGFGGNVIRQQVKDNAKWYITDFVELVGELEE
ncbi:phosphoserine phosphatase isoform X2 [Rhinopithecus roxellana]|uniref:Phosphoserine phosphatase n=3 Tax=Rhinopithecus TaxID=542827 RepID=A0A2K6LJ88_RHIBE|nr:PREDICTED: phosphoserine phosphatase isoform X4 [Rhinopithecus bieti]XP_030788028.1 phosphoserine phosphatase isoform X2 [Rhinopithecus roxellana]